MRDEIDRYWREEADLFDGLYTHSDRSPLGAFVGRFLNERLHKIVPLLRQRVREGDRVLDVGCGSGWYLELLLQMGATVTGVDYSAEMLRLAAERLAGYDPARWTLIEGDACALAVDDGQFDVGVAIGLLDYVEDTAAILGEFRRVLVPGGRLLVTVPKSPSPFFFLRTRPGNLIRRALLGLPPIVVTMTRPQVRAAVTGAGFDVEGLDVVQGTMWIVDGMRL